MLQPGQIVGNFEVVRRIGRGAFADVFEARQVLMDRHVALKVMVCGGRPSDEQLREARLLAFLSHPNILQIYDAGICSDPDTGQSFLYLATELLSGGSLRDHLESVGGPLPVAEAVAVATAICDALDCAHEHGVIHRDVKPENVLLTADGVPKLADFGVSRLLPEGQVASSVVGTALYLAPEGWGGATHRSDIWSVGAVLYEMLCGRPPFTGRTPAEIERRIRRGHHPPLSELMAPFPPGLSAVVDTALERQPAKRYARARELAAALEPYAAREGSAHAVTPTARVLRGTSPTAVRRMLGRASTFVAREAAAAIVAIIVTGLLGYLGFWLHGRAVRGAAPVRRTAAAPVQPAHGPARRVIPAAAPGPSSVSRPMAGAGSRESPGRGAAAQALPPVASAPPVGGGREASGPSPQRRAESLYSQAREKLRAGDRATGIRLLEACVAADSKHVAAHTQLALCYADSGEASRAVSELETVVGLEPRKVGPRTMLARAYGELGQAEKAAAQWRKVLELDATNAEAREALGLASEE